MNNDNKNRSIKSVGISISNREGKRLYIGRLVDSVDGSRLLESRN